MDGLKISELAERAGVNVSTVRYYERVGLVPDPSRSHSGSRLYDNNAETRLLFITRARRLGMTLEQVAELLGVWDGSNCATTRAGVVNVLDENLTEIARLIGELVAFQTELAGVRAALTADTPAVCGPDLSCCTPRMSRAVPVELKERRS
jgi:DNA-binding transcriptional MerR regulator